MTGTWQEDYNRRLQNLIDLTNAIRERINARPEFGTDEELEEVGLLTMRLAMIEEHVAQHCEILLIRPELQGFINPKPVLMKGLGEKLDLYRSLVVAVGTLHSISTEGVEESIRSARDLGEERNTVIHGYFFRKTPESPLVFRNKTKEIPARLDSLLTITDKCVAVGIDLLVEFGTFYQRLTEKVVQSVKLSESENSQLREAESALATLFSKAAAWHRSTAELRRITRKHHGRREANT